MSGNSEFQPSQKNPERINMSEILEMKTPQTGLNGKINDIPHYPKFEEIIGELTHSQLVAMAKGYYEVVVELKGGVIDE